MQHQEQERAITPAAQRDEELLRLLVAHGTGRTLAPLVCGARASFRQDQPPPAVDELTGCVEMTGVAGRLGHHVQDDFPQIV